MKLGLYPTLALTLALASTSHAATILIDSHAGLDSISFITGVPVHGPTVAINTHTAWQPNAPTNPGDPTDTDAVWISYAQTGPLGADFQPFSGNVPGMNVFYGFSSLAAGTLNLSVWADDTASVLLDGDEIAHASFTQNICAAEPIGCVPGMEGRINVPLAAGDHTLEFRVFQVGVGGSTDNNPFGLMFTGAATWSGIGPNNPPTDTPEPGTLALGGLAMLAAVPLKRLFKSTSR